MISSRPVPFSGTLCVLLLGLCLTGCADHVRPPKQDLHGDTLPTYAVARLGTARFLPQHNVWAIAMSPDGRFAATASIPGSESSLVELWDAATGHKIATPLTATHNILGLAWSPDNRELAIGHAYRVQIWERETWRIIRTLETASDGKGGTWSLAYSRDGGSLIGYSGADRVFVWNMETGKIVAQRRFDDDVHGVAFADDDKSVIVSSGTTVHICSTKSLQSDSTIPAHPGTVLSARLSPDGKHLAVCVRTQDTPPKYRVQLRKADSGELVAQSAEHSGDRADTRFLSSDNSLLSSAWGDYVRIWDASSLEPRKVLEQAGRLGPCSSTSQDGAILASADRRIVICKLPTGELVSERPSHRSMIRGIVLARKSQRVYTIASDSSLRIWSAPDGEQLTHIASPEHGFASLALSPDEQQLATGHSDGLIRLRNPETGEILSELGTHDSVERELSSGQTESVNGVSALAFSPDGSSLFSAGADGTIRSWNVAQGRQVTSRARECKFPGLGCSGIEVARDGRLLVSSGGGNMPVQLWDVKSDRLIRDIPESHSMFWAPFDLSHDGKRLVVSGIDKQAVERFKPGHPVPFSVVRLLQTENGDEIWRSDVGPHVTAVACSPRGRVVVSAHFAAPYAIHIWSGDTGKLLTTLRGHIDAVRCLAFNADGSLLVSGGQDTNALVWDVNAILEDHR